MENLPLISVIVPVYNVKTYLTRCVESAVFQTYPNLEILLIDDGSTDGGGSLCDELAKKYKKVLSFHKKNGGLSDARNYGMERMKGEYFFFLDGDDYINSNAIQILYSASMAMSLDIVECEYKEVKDLNRTNYYFGDCLLRKDSVKAFLFQSIKWKQHYGVAWNKLYRTSKFGKYRFPYGKTNEDEFFVNQWLGSARFIGYVSAPLYYYTIRSNSIMGRPYSINRVDGIEAYVNRFAIIKTRFPDVIDDFLAYIGNHVVGKIDLMEKQGVGDAGAIKSRMAEVLKPLRSLFQSANKLGPRNKGILADLFVHYSKEEAQ